MNILIIGASTKTSIGYGVGEILRKHGHTITYASRRGALGERCDISNPKAVRSLIVRRGPDVVVVAAGVFSSPRRIGNKQSWKRIGSHICAKSLGALVVANELAREKKEVQFIALGGREISSHPGFVQFTVGNGALWSLVRFLNTHTRIPAYYVDLPFVTSSTMHQEYIRATHTHVSGEVTPIEIAETIKHIIALRPKRRRIVLGGGGA